ncbi:hypothetical protein [Yinghuangia sp. YIM S10712]|uniref:hypothetical protein n=1 Tax=Yinghuangia sp. YIM S10712 TaxID=3436930 RepID=UPI003F52A856
MLGLPTYRDFVPGRLDVTVVRCPSPDQPIVLRGRTDVQQHLGTHTPQPALPLFLSIPAAVELTAQLALALVDLDVAHAQVVNNRLTGAIEAYRQGRPIPPGIGLASGWFERPARFR